MTLATPDRLNIVILGLSITSSWGNGHATTYRGLARELCAQGHDVLFLERDVPWYASNRDMPAPPFGRTELYGSLEELRDRFTDAVRRRGFCHCRLVCARRRFGGRMGHANGAYSDGFLRH